MPANGMDLGVEGAPPKQRQISEPELQNDTQHVTRRTHWTTREAHSTWQQQPFVLEPNLRSPFWPWLHFFLLMPQGGAERPDTNLTGLLHLSIVIRPRIEAHGWLKGRRLKSCLLEAFSSNKLSPIRQDHHSFHVQAQQQCWNAT